jgi:hypothetical protein
LPFQAGETVCPGEMAEGVTLASNILHEARRP